MPIRSQCPHCSAAFKVDESYIGQMVVCTKCKNQYQVTQPQAAPVAVTPTPTPSPAQAAPAAANPTSIGPLGASAAAAGPVGSAPVTSGAAIPKSRRRAKRGGMFRAPAGGNAFRGKLWFGLLLFVGTFAFKQIAVDFSLVRTNSATEVARLSLAREAAKSSVSHQAFELELELREMRSGAFDPNEEYLKKQEQLKKVREANKGGLEKVDKKYNKLMAKAQRNLSSATATNLFLLQMSWWIKLLLDLAKIAGCFLVLYSAMQIVCDPDENSQVKTFATVCSGIVLSTILALSIVSVFG